MASTEYINSDCPSPCYVLDTELLKKNVSKFKTLKSETGVSLLLALKGFNLPAAFPIISKVFSGTAASSSNESSLGAEFFGPRVHAYSPAYSDDEFEQMIKVCGSISLNSLTQFDRFKTRGLAANASLGLRVNPEYSDVEVELYNPCSEGSRLGVRAEQLRAKGLPKEVSGLHIHNLCESRHEAFEKTLASFESLFADYFEQLKWINFGGGHLITADDYDVQRLAEALKGFSKRHPHLELILEPGAAVVWQTGVLLATVEDIIPAKKGDNVLLDVSFTCHMPDCLEMPYKPEIRGALTEGSGPYTLGGSSCLAGDSCGEYFFEKPLKLGDRLIFEDMMHYTFVKSTHFNGVKHPAIALRDSDGKIELVKSFDYNDFVNRLRD